VRVPLGWLAEWIELPPSVDELVDRLTAAGLEVDEILRTGPVLCGLVIGQVLERGVDELGSQHQDDRHRDERPPDRRRP